MTYPIIVPEYRDTSTRKKKTRRSDWQLQDLSPRLLDDIGVVRQRNGRYASAAVRRSAQDASDTGAAPSVQGASAL